MSNLAINRINSERLLITPTTEVNGTTSTAKKISNVLCSFFKTTITLALVATSALSLGGYSIVSLMTCFTFDKLFLLPVTLTNIVSSILTGAIDATKHPKIAQIVRKAAFFTTAAIVATIAAMSLICLKELILLNLFSIPVLIGTAGLIAASASIRLLISSLSSEKLGMGHILGLIVPVISALNFLLFQFTWIYVVFTINPPPIG